MKKIFALIIIALTCNIVIAQNYNKLTISSVRNLTFPSLLPGISSTLVTTSTSAGRFYVTTTANMTVSVTFNLPANLNSGGNNLPITFTATKSTTSNDATLGTSFDPYTGTTYTRTGSNNANMYFRLGGTIPTPSTQAAGNYSGTIIMTVTIIN